MSFVQAQRSFRNETFGDFVSPLLGAVYNSLLCTINSTNGIPGPGMGLCGMYGYGFHFAREQNVVPTRGTGWKTYL